MSGRAEWTGTPSELFTELSKIAADEGLDRLRQWPKAVSAFTRRLRALAHNLAEGGIGIQEFREGKAGARKLTLQTRKMPSANPSAITCRIHRVMTALTALTIFFLPLRVVSPDQ